MNDITQNIDAGAQTIGQALGFDPIGSGGASPPRPLLPPRLGETPPFPEPGIYFDMDEDVYHAIPACSQSGMKKIASSPMLFWATSWMNPKRPNSESRFKNLGKAYHARIMEPHCYMQKFARALVPEDMAGTDRQILSSTDDVKAALADHGIAAPTRIGTGVFVPAPTLKDPEKKKENTRAAVKADLVDMLLEVDPDALIWDRIVADYNAEHAGKILIDGEEVDRIEIAARMIELDDELKDAFVDGHAEVSIFWFCERTGAPMKARMDYLKPRSIVDLKSFSNPLELTIERAIARAIANGKYPVQVVNYLEAVEAAKALIRKRGASAIAVNPFLSDDARAETVEWALRWAKLEERPEFLYVFQQTGIAPVTRGVWFPIGGTTWMVTRDAVERLKRKFVECAQAFGTDPWVDVIPTYTIPDEEIPSYATDI